MIRARPVSPPLPLRAVLAFGLLLASPLPMAATCGGGGGGGIGGLGGLGDETGEPNVYRVPWKVLLDGLPDGDLKLLWMPGSAIEARTGELLESRYLNVMAGQCVGLGLLPPDNPVRTRLAPTGSTVVLVDRDGSELARVSEPGGELRPSKVERLLREAIESRRKALDDELDQGEAKRKAGDVEGAVSLYDGIWRERCLFPGTAKKAAKALRKLGREVDEDATLDLPAPDLDPEVGSEVEAALRAGLEAEAKLDLERARREYEKAVRLDPNDPVAARDLGEFHRHQTGDWAEARRLFARVLALRADPISRAVALHGLGKMTIHGGDFATGVGMIEQSIATWPLPLAYRNLAVYWFSENDFAKAKGYVDAALALAPDDAYNRIFAAVYLVEMGRPEEARAVAEQENGLIEASYNLAAIWARLGDREKMLELLARHFYVYERFEAVRRREMQEARDDAVFAAYRLDPAFVELTRDAELDSDSYHGSGAGAPR